MLSGNDGNKKQQEWLWPDAALFFLIHIQPNAPPLAYKASKSRADSLPVFPQLRDV
jgi:hypothetical protein